MKDNWKVRVTIALVFGAVFAIGVWILGVPLTRGPGTAMLYGGLVAVAVIGLTCPLFDK